MTSTLERPPHGADPLGLEQPFAEEPSRESQLEPRLLEPSGLDLWESPNSEDQVSASPVVTVTACHSQLIEPRYALVRSHVGTSPDLVLRWSGVAAAGPVDVVVHFHGYSDSLKKMRIDKEKLPDSGLDFCDPRTGGPGRTTPTLAILPRGSFFGGKLGTGYNFPNLVVRGAVNRLIDDSLARLAQQTGLAVTRGRVILTGHSGGGAPVTSVVKAVDPDEVHIFDGLYGDVTRIVEWAQGRVAREMANPAPIPPALRVIYRPGTKKHPGTQPGSEDLAKRICRVLAQAGAQRLSPRFRVDRTTTVQHGDIPRRFGWALLADASATLADTTTLVCGGTPRTQGKAEFDSESQERDEAMEAMAWSGTESSEAGEFGEEGFSALGGEGLAWEQTGVATEFPESEGETWSEGDLGRESSEDRLLGSDRAWPHEAGESPLWTGTPEQIAFREAVLTAHLERSRRRKGEPGTDLSPGQLSKVAGTDVQMRTDAAEAAGRMLAAAIGALAAARQAGDRDALRTIRLAANSGYRGRDHQARLWRRYFPGYYNSTADARETLEGGRHGPSAQRYMIETFGLPNWIAAPGYSNHQNGIAIDLVQVRTKGSEISNSSNKHQLARWRDSWFFRWLSDNDNANARSFGFEPYKKEPWHWEFRQPDVSRFAESFDESAAQGESGEVRSFDLASDSEASYEAWLEDEESGEEFGEPEAIGEVEQPAGEWSSQLDLLLEPEDRNYFEGPAASLGFAPGEEGQVAGGEPANDPPNRVARPAWPGRRLRLTKRPYLHGADVLVWQRQMIARGWRTALGRPFKDDGIFGPQSAIVTSRFQQVQSLPITGIVDAITWGAAWTTGPGAAPPNVVYDRGAAFDYARKHWNVVTSDNFIAGTFGSSAFKSVPAGTRFVNDGNGTEHAVLPNGTMIPWTDLDDCTHFISCCIGQPPGGGAGGLPITGQLGSPPNAPYGIVRVSSLVSLLTSKKWVVLEGERSKDVSLIAKLQRGDLVAYFNETRGRYTHMALYLGNGKIACHTYCRFDKSIESAVTWDDDWDLGAGNKNFTWTFLRFAI